MRQKRFAGFVHRLDVLLEPLRGRNCTEPIIEVDLDCGGGVNRLAKDARDVARVALPGNTKHSCANIDIVAPGV
jgi:hypothetical protein